MLIKVKTLTGKEVSRHLPTFIVVGKYPAVFGIIWVLLFVIIDRN